MYLNYIFIFVGAELMSASLTVIFVFIVIFFLALNSFFVSGDSFMNQYVVCYFLM